MGCPHRRPVVPAGQYAHSSGDLGYQGPERAARLAEDGEMRLLTRDQALAHYCSMAALWTRTERTREVLERAQRTRSK